MNQVYAKLQNCYECVRKQTDFVPKVAIVLGSGLGDYAEQIRVVTEIPYAKIEGFPVSTVPGHAGKFIFGYLDEIPVCVGYDIDGEVTTDFPTTAKLKKAKPVYKVIPGWKQDIRGIKKYEDLPENCRKYIEFIEEQIGFPITMVSNGPKRSDIIYRGFNN